ncbi:MAG: multiheme c-type cytochrome [Planctomycetia bacterium]
MSAQRIANNSEPFKPGGGLLILTVAFVFWANYQLSSAFYQQSFQQTAESLVTKAALTESITIAGSASCSGRACHGGSQPIHGQVVGQNEYSKWIANDPHVNAFQVLFSDRAKNISKNLGGPEPHQDVRCLACHITPQASNLQLKADYALDFGVGCESCHGTATKAWLAEHTTADWKNLAFDKKQKAYESHGMNFLSNPTVQAQVCAGCHIGSPPDAEKNVPLRDANHDIMAAGHPRLIFEATTFAENMPPHWNENKYSKTPERKVELWANGQVIVAWASAKLAELRSGEKAEVWPEFAQNDCFACHADISNPSWRRSSDYYSGRKAGALPINNWPFAWLDVSLELLGKKEHSILKNLRDYQSIAEKVSSSKQQVNFASKGLVSSLSELVGELRQPGGQVSSDWKNILGKSLAAKSTSAASWDFSVQHSIASSVLASEEKAVPQAIWESLSFPPGYESPKGYKPALKKALNGK